MEQLILSSMFLIYTIAEEETIRCVKLKQTSQWPITRGIKNMGFTKKFFLTLVRTHVVV